MQGCNLILDLFVPKIWCLVHRILSLHSKHRFGVFSHSNIRVAQICSESKNVS